MSHGTGSGIQYYWILPCTPLPHNLVLAKSSTERCDTSHLTQDGGGNLCEPYNGIPNQVFVIPTTQQGAPIATQMTRAQVAESTSSSCQIMSREIETPAKSEATPLIRASGRTSESSPCSSRCCAQFGTEFISCGRARSP